MEKIYYRYTPGEMHEYKGIGGTTYRIYKGESRYEVIVQNDSMFVNYIKMMTGLDGFILEAEGSITWILRPQVFEELHESITASFSDVEILDYRDISNIGYQDIRGWE